MSVQLNAEIQRPSLLHDHQIRFERIKALYRQAPNSMLAALTVALYMVVTMWDKVAHSIVCWWLLALAATQLIRIWAYFCYRRELPEIARAGFWANCYSIYMVATGMVWASCALLFMQADQPLANALVMMGLYGLGAGSIAGVAYNPVTLVLFLLFIFMPVALRLISFGGADYITLGIATAVYMCLLIVFGLIFARSILESMQMRFENLDLVAQLQVEKVAAEQAKGRAEEASLAKSRFFAAASHDLRQPLHALGLYSESMRESGIRIEQMPLLDNMSASIDALESLFDELLDISKLDAGVIQPKQQHFPVQCVFDKIIAQFNPVADDQGLKLKVRSTTLVAFSDPVLLERVLSNLVSNALRYCKHGGVLMACRHRQAQLLIEVWDTGLGISTEHQEKIFQEFYQVDNPERDRRKGLGLGLAIVQRLALLMGHPLSFSSIVGRGSVFRIQTPIGETQKTSQQTAAKLPPVLDLMVGKRILVIDDELTILEGMRDLLTRWRSEVQVATSIAEALQRVAEAIPDLIISDYRLPASETGVQVIAAIKAAVVQKIPAILMTGDTAPGRMQEAIESGYTLLHKPVKPAQLRAACNQLLSRHINSE